MPVAAKRYAYELLKEINADREAHGKAPFDDDKNGYILGVEVTPGNVHDSVAFDDVYEEVTERFPKVKTIVRTKHHIYVKKYSMTAELFR